MSFLSAIPVWLIVVAVLIVLLIILMRTTNQVYVLYLIKDNFFYFFMLAIFVFLAISISMIHTNLDSDVKLFSAEGAKVVGKVYYSWAAGVFSNIGKVTSYAIQQDWFGGTNSTAK